MTIDVGSQLGPWTIEHVDPAKMKVLAVVLADPNPIHLEPEAVKVAGLGDRVINQGPANFGYLLNMLRDAAPAATVRDLNVRMTASVFGGDKVVAAGRVESAQHTDGERLLLCRVWLDIAGGARAVEGTATLALTEL